MTRLAPVGVALTTAALGLVIAGGIANFAVGWYRVPGFGVGSAYFIGFNALLGAVAGFVVGLVVSRALNNRASMTYVKTAGVGSAVVVLIGSAALLSAWMLADIPPQLEGKQLNLEVEWSIPASDISPPAEVAQSSFTLSSVVDRVSRKAERGRLKLTEARLEDGRWIIPSTVFLFTTRGTRMIRAQLGADVIGVHVVPLPNNPGAEFESWSEWLPRTQGAARAGTAGKAAAPAATAKTPAPSPAPAPASSPKTPSTPATAASKGAPAGAESVPQYRFRIARMGQPKKQETPDAKREKTADEERAAFAAIRPDAAIESWFPYTRFGAPEERRAIAMRNVLAKPGFVDELARLMLSANHQVAAEALYLTGRLASPPAALIDAVVKAGQDIAARIDALNAVGADKVDDIYIRSVGIAIRFAAWIEAVKPLRKTGAGDFVPELVAILERSRVRTDSVPIQQEVRRIASHYAKEWAGIAAQAGDPPH